MHLEMLKPCKRLEVIIKSYTIIDISRFSHDHIPPLGFPVLQFHINNNIETYFSEYKLSLSRKLIIGQLTSYANLHTIQNSKIIGVNFQVTSLYKMFNISLKQFTDTAKPAIEFFGNNINKLFQTLNKASDKKEMVCILNSYFQTLINEKSIETEPFDLLITEIERRNGIISVSKMQEIYPASERTLQRLFRDRVGVSPKMFCMILRHLNIFKIIKANPRISFAKLVYECGYSDSAHFSKDFKKIAGITPAEYFMQNEQFADLLTRD